jgi:hypothetical protein
VKISEKKYLFISIITKVITGYIYGTILMDISKKDISKTKKRIYLNKNIS